MGTPIFDKTYIGTQKTNRKTVCSIKGFDDDLIVLKMTSQDTPNIQIDLSLTSETYLLDFGEKLSPITISGIVPLTATCSEDKVKSRLNELYKKHKLNKDPVAVTIGTDSYTAYVTGKSAAVSAERPELLNFSLTFLGYKNDAKKGGGGGAGSPTRSSSKKSSSSSTRGSSTSLGGGSSSGMPGLGGNSFDIRSDFPSINDSGKGTTHVADRGEHANNNPTGDTKNYLRNSNERGRLHYNNGLWHGYSMDQGTPYK